MIENLKRNFITGIDIGGSHITAGLIDMKNRTIVDNIIIRQRVDSHAPEEEILTGWCQAIKALWKKMNITAAPLGFAMPGPFDYVNGICLIKGNDKYEALYQLNIRKVLAERLGLPEHDISFRNDAEAFLEGEMFCGAATGFTNAIGITLGTGLGSAFSHNGFTADAALSVLQYNGEKIEEFVSTRGIVRNYERLSGRKLKDAKAVAELYDTDTDAKNAFIQFGNDLSWFLEYFVRRENPEILVIGGNIVQAWDLYMPAVLQHLSTIISQLPKIVKASLGESGILIGGACCFVLPQHTPANKSLLAGTNLSTIVKTP